MESWSRFLLTPPVFDDEDQTQLARLLHRILLFSILALTVTALGLIVIGVRQTQHVVVYLAISLVIDFVCLTLLYQGYVRVVGYLLALSTWGLCAGGVLLLNGLHSASIGFLIFPIIYGFLMLGRRPGAMFLGLSLLTLVAAYVVDSIADLPVYRMPSTGIVLAYALVFVFSAWVVDTVTVYLRQSVTRAQNAEHELRRKSDLQTLVTQLSTEFVNMPPDEIEANIHHGMEQVSQFVGAAACRIWFFSDDYSQSTLTHEWIAPGQPAMINVPATQGESTVPYAWLLEATLRLETVIVPNTSDLPPEAAALQNFAALAAVSSVIYVPFIDNGRAVGSIAFSMARELTDWSEDMTHLLTMAGMIFAQALARQKADAQRHALIAERERTAAIHEFIGNVTHDIKNPLAVIRTNLYVARHASQSDKRAQSLDTIEQQAERINVLVEDLLMLARLDSVQQLDLVPTDLTRLLAEIADDLRPVAENKGLTYTVDLAPVLPPVLADTNALRRALVNLVENAVHYTPRGQSVELHGEINAGGVAILVIDTGIGIPAADLPRIFDRFFRAENAHTVSGTGLGLAIVQQIIDMHGGQISVESQEGQGSTFRVLLPPVPA